MFRPTFNMNIFSYHTDDVYNTFAADISELPDTRRLPAKFYIISERTGVKKLFLFSKAEKNNEGETTSWHFFTPEDDNDIFRVIIFND